MRTWSLTKRLIKQILRDKRSVALLFIAPLLVLWLLSLVFTTSATKSTIDIVNASSFPFVDLLKKTDATIVETSLDEAKKDVTEGRADGYVTYENKKFNVVLEGSDPTHNRAVIQALQAPLQKLSPAKNLFMFTYLHGGESLTSLDYLAPALIGFFIFFFVFLISGVSFLRERTGGTLERVLATPLRRHEIVLGYFFGFGLFAGLQTVFVQWYALNILGIQSAGNFWSVLLVNILVATVALSLGTLLSAFAKNEFQMVQFIPLVVVPQIFLSGLFDLRGMPLWLMELAKVLPLKHAADALRSIMIRGEGLAETTASLFVLLGYCVLFLVLNVFALRRYRKI